jgi:hypothetical protein
MIVSLLLIISGIAMAWYVYENHIRAILAEQCLVDSYNCVTISYWSYENSVLFTLRPYGYSCWYDGDSIYVYDAIANTQLCPMTIIDDDTNIVKFVSAYKLQKTPFLFSTSSSNQQVCIESIESIKKYYEDLGVTEKTLRKIVPGFFISGSSRYNESGTRYQNSNFSVYDAINLLVNEKIIKI